MFSKILIAFDGNNLNVIRALAKVSRSPDVKIYLVSVVTVSFMGRLIRTAAAMISKDWRPAAFPAIEKSATTAVQDLAVYSDKVVCFVRVGDPYSVMKGVIKETQPDLIIMGGSLPIGDYSRFSKPTIGMRIAAMTKATLILAR